MTTTSSASRLCLFVAILLCGNASATIYEVGDGQAFTSISSVPWESLVAGDEVHIHWRAAPYREKWVIARQGTQAQPIRVVGVPGPGGELPVIDGRNATTRLALDYWNEPRAVIKVGGSSIPSDVTPRWIEIANLDIAGARPPGTFTDDAGNAQSYAQNGASIFIEKGENITVRNCILRESGNGLFVASSDEIASRDILIEGCWIHGNGNNGSIFEHNTYTAAIGITYQYNLFGPPVSGAGGNNLKDRSAGLVVRYNWIEGGNRQLDLVDAEDSSQIEEDPSYRTTFIYGNVLLEPSDMGNKQIVHYGGDSGVEEQYRKGILHFYHNTVISRRSNSTTLFRLSTNDEHCDARNNVFYVTHAGSGLSILDSTGIIDLTHNWHRPGWIPASSGLEGEVHDDGTSLTGANPDFFEEALGDYRLGFDSNCIDAAAALHPDVLPSHAVVGQYLNRMPSIRHVQGSGLDVGAFEAACLGDLNFDDAVDLSDLAGLLANFGCGAGCYGDVNDDDAVDLADLADLLSAFGSACD